MDDGDGKSESDQAERGENSASSGPGISTSRDSIFRRHFWAVIVVLILALVCPALYSWLLENPLCWYEEPGAGVAIFVSLVLLALLIALSGVTRVKARLQEMTLANPVAGLLAAAQHHRHGRRSVLESRYLPAVVASASTLLYSAVWLPEAISEYTASNSFGYDNWIHIGSTASWIIVQVLCFAVAPAFLIWVMQVVYQTARDCLSFLALPDRSRTAFHLDENLAASALTSREILYGLLTHVVPRLAIIVLIGTALALLVHTAAIFAQADFWSVGILISPLGTLLLLSTGSLSSLALVLTLISAGRSTVAPQVAGFTALCQGIWLGLLSWEYFSSINVFCSITSTYSCPSIYFSTDTVPYFSCLVLLLGLVYVFSLRAALRHPLLGVTPLLVLPGTITVAALLIVVASFANHGLREDSWARAILACTGFGVLVNPTIVLAFLELDSDWTLYLYLAGWLILAQGLTVWALWGIAHQAIERRRQEMS